MACKTTSKALGPSRWVGVFVEGVENPIALFSDEYALEAAHFAVLWAHGHLLHYEIREVSLGQTGMSYSDPYPPVVVKILQMDKEKRV